MKSRVKRTLKLAGSILMVVALIFIVKKIMLFDDSIWVSLKEIHYWIVVIILFINIVQNLFCCIPWGILVNHLTGKEITYLQLAEIHTKSSIFKYVPGNIFQYVGRNELALKKDLSHVDVGISTVLDTVIMFGTAAIISFSILGGNTFHYFAENSSTILLFAAVFGMIILSGFCLIYLKFEKVRNVIKKYKSILSIKVYLKCFACYFFVNFIGCVNLAVVLLLALGQKYPWEVFMRISGAYIFAFIVGFITPGVSGGIGVREAVMIMLTDSLLPGDVILAAMVLLRFASVISDIAAYGVIKLITIVQMKYVVGKDIKR